MYNPLKIIIKVDGTQHECLGVSVQDQETGMARPASEQETVALIMNNYQKPAAVAYSLKAGGTLILGPMAAARAQIFVKANEPGAVKLPQAPSNLGDN